MGWLVMTVLAALAIASPAAAREPDGSTFLRAAWVTTGNGLVMVDSRRPGIDSPIDLQILSAAAQRADIGIAVAPMGRAAAEAALAGGEVDVLLPSAVSGPATSARWTSIPYRSERDVLLCARGLAELGQDGVGALAEAYGRGWRIGIVRDAPYRADIDALNAGAPAGQALRFGHAGAAIAAIAAGTAHCVVAPRLAILAALAAAPTVEGSVARKAVDLGTTDLRLRFATTVAPEAVAALDTALAALRSDGAAAELEAKASRPVLLRFAVATQWFSWLDMIGTVAFALSGVLIARAERFSLLGAFVLAALPAVGGGVIRDLLVGRSPIGILADPLPLVLVVGTVLVAYAAGAIARLIDTPRLPAKLFSPAMALEVTDAVGLAAFTVIGVSVAVRTGAEPLWLWGPLAAALSGAGGGILRDLLRNGYENPALRTSFYAEVCVLWGFVLTMAILFLLRADQPALVRLSVGITVLGAFATRMAVVGFGVRSPRF